jgi:4-amino-4-deoxy-L-arabinose transferase-like glycosyltransferase
LFNEQLAGQASWLIPLALLSAGVIALQTKLHWPARREHQNVLLWSIWLITMIAFFSVANLFHRYYLEMLSPAIAALIGAGLAGLWRDYQQGKWPGWLLPFALIGTAAVEAFILSYYPQWAVWLAPVVVGLTLLAATGLIAFRVMSFAGAAGWRKATMVIGLLAILIAPTAWAVTPVLAHNDAALPFAGPELIERGMGNAGLPNMDKLIEYLQAHRAGEKYLVAAPNANTAAPIIITTGEPVMAMGGFSGSDRILSVDQLAQLVADGEVRFFMASTGGRGSADLTNWITTQCQAVPLNEWAAADGPNANRPPVGSGPNGGGAPMLYDCGM